MIKVGIVGVSGYTGLELVKMLLNHKHFEVTYLATTQGADDITKLHPSLQTIFSQKVEVADVDTIVKNCELVFLAVPHKSAMELVKPLMQSDIKIVDFSADYRLTQELYEKAYCPHTDVDNLKNSVYALIELYREEIKKARLVAGPGCYPTASLLGLAPFLKVITSSVFIDAKSGVSGAGKKLSDVTHFVNVNENMFAYAPFEHRHGVEISQKVALLGREDLEVFFVPHLIPSTRGMLASIYCSVEEDIDAIALLQEFYKDEAFIRIRTEPVSMKDVAGTHFCDIYVKQQGTTLFIESAIDNLLRGASSQALAAANLMCGIDEGEGIPLIAYAP